MNMIQTLVTIMATIPGRMCTFSVWLTTHTIKVRVMFVAETNDFIDKHIIASLYCFDLAHDRINFAS